MTDVSIVTRPGASYPKNSPYHPGEAYPEAPFSETARGPNDAYAMVRDCLRGWELDAEHFGSPDWNPLGTWIKRGQNVLIKPNLVLDRHPRGGDLECLITHGSVIRALLDYVLIALDGDGKITIGDSPLQGTDFDGATEGAGLPGILTFVGGAQPVPVDLVDFRQVHAEMDERFHVRAWKEVAGDPAGYVEFDLAERSALAPFAAECGKFRVSNYRAKDTLQYHNRASHRYVIAGSVIDADVILDVPKMKTHCKAGVTLALKNFVGSVGRKQCLAHHRHGSRILGGDEYPDLNPLKSLSVRLEDWIDGNRTPPLRGALSFAYRVNERLMKMLGLSGLREGAWHGNDTVWRMVVDLVRIAVYGQRAGTMADTPQRQVISFIDGLVGGENEGPLEATPISSGCVVGGSSMALVDAAVATLMGFDPARIPLLREALEVSDWPVAPSSATETVYRLNGAPVSLDALRRTDVPAFAPSEGWAGHIEQP